MERAINTEIIPSTEAIMNKQSFRNAEQNIKTGEKRKDPVVLKNLVIAFYSRRETRTFSQ